MTSPRSARSPIREAPRTRHDSPRHALGRGTELVLALTNPGNADPQTTGGGAHARRPAGDRAPLCKQYKKGQNARAGSSLRAGGFLAALRVDRLPPAVHHDDHVIHRGYAVAFGQWFFFPALEPAIAFGRAARMSTECHSYGVYEAAAELRYCADHRRDERVLLITGHSLHRSSDPELDLLKRFVQGAKENPHCPHWRAPTGYLTELVRGRPVQSHRRSLPL